MRTLLCLVLLSAVTALLSPGAIDPDSALLPEELTAALHSTEQPHVTKKQLHDTASKQAVKEASTSWAGLKAKVANDALFDSAIKTLDDLVDEVNGAWFPSMVPRFGMFTYAVYDHPVPWWPKDLIYENPKKAPGQKGFIPLLQNGTLGPKGWHEFFHSTGGSVAKAFSPTVTTLPSGQVKVTLKQVKSVTDHHATVVMGKHRTYVVIESYLWLNVPGIKDMRIFAPGINAYKDYISTLDPKVVSMKLSNVITHAGLVNALKCYPEFEVPAQHFPAATLNYFTGIAAKISRWFGSTSEPCPTEDA